MINTIDGIIAAAKGGKTGVIAVAAAHDQPVIQAVVEARREGIATPILVGHEEEIKAMLTGLGEAPADYEIIAGDTDQDCAAKAVALCAGSGTYKASGFVLGGGVLDTERAAHIVLDEFRAGKIARVTLDDPREEKNAPEK